MYLIIDINSDYVHFKGMIKGSQEKMDFKYKEKEYMFKEPKINCGDCWSEKIATELGKVLEIKIQEVDLAKYNNKQGVLVEYSLARSKGEELTEGSILLNEKIEDFDEKSTYSYIIVKEILDQYSKEVYENFLDIIFFDALIGNTDRHCENWGIVETKEGKIRMISIYDNSSSLGRELHSNTERKKNLLEDETKFNNYINGNKSLIIGLEENKKGISHFLLLKEVLNNNPLLIEKYKRKLEGLSFEKIENIVKKIPEEFMDNDSKELAIKILVKRKDKINEILSGE